MNCEKNTDIPSAKPHSIPRYLFNCRDASLLPSNFPSFSASLVTRSLTLQYRSCDHRCNMSSRSLRRFIVAVILLAAIQDLDKRGVKIVIGPQSSSEVAMIKPYADAHNILVISQGSTASSLAIAGDNIFRFCPNDMREAEAIVALMWHDGIRTIVPLWRNDAGNNGLHDSVKADFEKLGGNVTTGYQYQPTTTDFSTATTSVASQVSTLLIAGADPNSVRIYLAAFDEVVSVFHSAASNSTLSSTHWYGSDGVALSAALVGDSDAAAFAANAGYPNPTFGLPDALQSLWQPVANAI